MNKKFCVTLEKPSRTMKSVRQWVSSLGYREPVHSRVIMAFNNDCADMLPQCTCVHLSKFCLSVCLSVCLLIQLRIYNNCIFKLNENETRERTGTVNGINGFWNIIQKSWNWFETDTRTRTNCFLLCQAHSLCRVPCSVTKPYMSVLSNILTGPEHMWRWRLFSRFSS